MKLTDFDEFLCDEIIPLIQDTLSSKSADYAGDNDKLFNFKQQGRIDNITPFDALRGNWLKHRASISQGLEELHKGKVRSYDWWKEKCIDNINYTILLLAMVKEYFDGKE